LLLLLQPAMARVATAATLTAITNRWRTSCLRPTVLLAGSRSGCLAPLG
jgi:hypothetical protein